MVNLDNSASVLPDYIDVTALRGESELKATDFENQKNSFNNDSVTQAAGGNPGASEALQGYKIAMENAIQWYEYKNAELKNTLAASAETDYAQAYNAKKATVDTVRKTVTEQRELDAIREEQVKSLENRNAANYHTSWLGLQRPMKEGSHIGLLVAAGFFAILAILGFVYLYRVRMEIGGFPDMGFRGGTRRYTK